MANLSYSAGTISVPQVIINQHTNAIKDLFILIHSELNPCNYNTSFELEDVIGIQTSPNDTGTFQIDFYGTGRWAYNNNVIFFFETLFDDLKTTQYANLINELAPYDNLLTFSYTDYEASSEYLVEETLIIGIDWLDNEIKTKVTKHDITEYDITAKKLIEFGYYEEAYDAENAKELINHSEFLNLLSESVPADVITEDFLVKAWKENVRYVYDGEALFDNVLTSMIEYYESAHL
ncbi:hypothetical protein [Listeria booriae]|uniref:Uncharacterized protein n=1 Tax=Listeria booriae TaxID=1552123 RepID=A0A7X1DA99_9LIST|nr:hypothetical protein [Listeria booriae]MBC1914212.1 hypothetical protein [Listeria booriae]MBC2173912.1 hypothetical protein [Listeria booriae]MBC2178232.1 hypothetical protein [Listeria booriae]MBC2178241.1 hypothetical protein [Listeria booriae]MDT0111608.1 hypothetical protein [Listeria booriae]